MKILRDQIEEKIRVIHRLDQPTSGVVIFATNRGAARKLREDFEKRRVKKRYLAMVHGHPAKEKWTCQIPLRKNPDSPEITKKLLEKSPDLLNPDYHDSL